MAIDFSSIDKFLNGQTSPEETITILSAIAVNPELEEYLITQKRLNYIDKQIDEYGSFVPAGSMAADDGENLCDLQCELFILKRLGIEHRKEDLTLQSRNNYWLISEGTPLFNMGKLLEANGLFVNRIYDSSIEHIKEYLKDYQLIAVVNGDVLDNKAPDILSDDFCIDNSPNHAVVVLDLSEESKTVSIYNPAMEGESIIDYPLDVFADAWKESKNYLVLVRKKKEPHEYNPQPIDVSGVSLDSELENLTEMIAEHVHDIWAIKRKAEGVTYGPVRDKTHNPDMLPYHELPPEEQQYDRDMAINAIKLVKRLGYRLVNINNMFKCPDCGEALEPSFSFCPRCGRQLSWEDFK